MVWSVLLLSLLLVVGVGTKANGDEGSDPEGWIREAATALSKVENYTAIFHKQERVDGKLMEEETILLKFKRPFKIYMKWIEGPYKGRELLYAEGWNKNRMMVRDNGITGIMTVSLDPKGTLARKGNRHPVTDSGLENLVKLFRDYMRRGIKEEKIDVKKGGEEILYGRRTQRIEIILPKEKAKGFYSYRAVINLDIEKKVPIKVQMYNSDNKLIEKYAYEDLRFNPGLTDADFSPQNPEYRF